MTQRDELVPASAGAVIRIADSARKAKPGELVYLDARGKEVDRKARIKLQVKLGVIAGAVMAIPLAALGLTGITGGLVGGGVIGLALAVARRRLHPFIAAQSRLTAGDIDGAEAMLAKAPQIATGMRGQARAWIEGWIAYARAQYAPALRHFERCFALVAPKDIRRVLLQIAMAEVHARSGDLARAKTVRDGITLPTDPGDLLVIGLAYTDLVLALVEGTEAKLDEDELHKWVRLALEINNTNLTLAALARVFAARGDDELADHLAREARDRFCWCPLEAWPELAAWVDARLAKVTASDEP